MKTIRLSLSDAQYQDAERLMTKLECTDHSELFRILLKWALQEESVVVSSLSALAPRLKDAGKSISCDDIEKAIRTVRG